jgi:hypothetical protein
MAVLQRQSIARFPPRPFTWPAGCGATRWHSDRSSAPCDMPTTHCRGRRNLRCIQSCLVCQSGNTARLQVADVAVRSTSVRWIPWNWICFRFSHERQSAGSADVLPHGDDFLDRWERVLSARKTFDDIRAYRAAAGGIWIAASGADVAPSPITRAESGCPSQAMARALWLAAKPSCCR